MKIYTSYFSNVRNLPEWMTPIAICGGVPDGWKGAWTRIVAPRKSFFFEWKNVNHNNDYYIEHFNNEVLKNLNPAEVAKKFSDMAGEGKTPCLICYEKPNDFCHRHLVADWLNKNVDGMECIEFNKKEFRQTIENKDEEKGIEIL